MYLQNLKVMFLMCNSIIQPTPLNFKFNLLIYLSNQKSNEKIH